MPLMIAVVQLVLLAASSVTGSAAATGNTTATVTANSTQPAVPPQPREPSPITLELNPPGGIRYLSEGNTLLVTLNYTTPSPGESFLLKARSDDAGIAEVIEGIWAHYHYGDRTSQPSGGTRNLTVRGLFLGHTAISFYYKRVVAIKGAPGVVRYSAGW